MSNTPAFQGFTSPFMENSHYEKPDRFGVSLCGRQLHLKRYETAMVTCQRCKQIAAKRTELTR